MNTENYINCLSSLASSTGFLKGSYNFSNQIESVALNDLYPTGKTYFKSGANNIFYSDKYNLNILSGQTNYSGAFSGQLDHPLSLRLTKFESPEDFKILMDFSIEDCAPSESRIIFSSTTGANIYSGLIFGFNQINKFFMEYGEGLNKKIVTFRNTDISKNNLISLAVKNDQFYFKKYNTKNGEVENNQVELNGFIHSNEFIFGKSFPPYSGFSGTINHIFVSKNNDFKEDRNYFECAFCTGVDTGVYTVTGTTVGFIDPLSFGMSGISGLVITGYETLVSFNNTLGIYEAEQSPLTQNDLIETVLTGAYEIQSGSYEIETSTVLIDNAKKSYYNNDPISINFIAKIESGDLLDIYDYANQNDNINKSYDDNFSTNIAVFSNGLLLIQGMDYNLSKGKIQYNGDSSDEIRVNKLNSNINYLEYSGLHENYRQNTGIAPNDGYYPESPQFLESGDGNITITGLNSLFSGGFQLTGHDLFMNGQKIYTGIDYETGNYGGQDSILIYAANFNDADLSITTGASGELLSIDKSTESILAFVPKQSESHSEILDFRTSAITVYPLSGKSAEIWLNGIKLIQNIDYSIKLPCKKHFTNFNFKNLPYAFFEG